VLSSESENEILIGLNEEGKVYIGGAGFENSEPASLVSINDGIWHFVAVQRDSNNYRLYVDDHEPAAIAQGPVMTLKSLVVGAKPDGLEAFNGAVDEVKLYDTAIEEASFKRAYLAEDEISLEYQYSRMRVKLTWKDMAKGEDGYVIDRKIGTGEWEVAGEVKAGVDYFIETVDLYDTIYSYRVRSAARFANAGSSNVVEVQTPKDPNTSALNIIYDDDFSIFPNPAENSFTLKSGGNIHVEIFDLQGKLMLEKTDVQNQQIFDISEFESGVYVVRIVDTEKSGVLKLVKN
jgi:hypothetical protein